MPEPIPAPALRSRPRLRWGLFVMAFVLGVALDLGTKEVAFSWLRDGYGCPNHAEVFTTRPNKACGSCDAPLQPRGSEKVVTSWFSFRRATNKGAAFGMFHGQHTFFMIVTVAAFVAVPYFVHTARRVVIGAAIVLGLILAGVFGNFWDRVLFGEVRDFLDFHATRDGGLYAFLYKVFDTATWPTFNVADMFITGGAIGILASQFFLKEEKSEPKAVPEASEAVPEASEAVPEGSQPEAVPGGSEAVPEASEAVPEGSQPEAVSGGSEEEPEAKNDD